MTFTLEQATRRLLLQILQLPALVQPPRPQLSTFGKSVQGAQAVSPPVAPSGVLPNQTLYHLPSAVLPVSPETTMQANVVQLLPMLHQRLLTTVEWRP